MSKYEIQLINLSDLFSDKRMLAAAEIVDLTTFLAGAINNRLLSKELRESLAEFMQLKTINVDVIATILMLSFCTRHIDEFPSILERIEICYKKMQAGQTLEDEDKISWREFSIVRGLSTLLPIFSLFEKHKIMGENKALGALAIQIKKCDDINQFIEKKLLSSIDTEDLFAQSTTKHNRLLNEFAYLLKIFVRTDDLQNINRHKP